MVDGKIPVSWMADGVDIRVNASHSLACQGRDHRYARSQKRSEKLICYIVNQFIEIDYFLQYFITIDI